MKLKKSFTLSVSLVTRVITLPAVSFDIDVSESSWTFLYTISLKSFEKREPILFVALVLKTVMTFDKANTTTIKTAITIIPVIRDVKYGVASSVGIK